MIINILLLGLIVLCIVNVYIPVYSYLKTFKKKQISTEGINKTQRPNIKSVKPEPPSPPIKP